MTVDAALRRAKLNFLDDRVSPRPGEFTPVGVMMHHTTSPIGRPDSRVLAVVQRGTTQVKNGEEIFIPGPLCNILVNRAGEIRLVTTGRANDSGRGNQEVLDRVRKDERVRGRATAAGSISGNPWFYDIEIANNGVGEEYSPAVWRASVGAAAALLHFSGWNPHTRLLGHKEWTSRKPDPSFDMGGFRSAVALEINAIVHRRGGAPGL